MNDVASTPVDVAGAKTAAIKPAVQTAAVPVKVAIDDGLARMKLCALDDQGKIRTWGGLTAIRPAAAGAMLDLGGDVMGMYETEEGERFVYSASTKTEETRFPDFHVSGMDRVLMHHALIQAGFAGREVTLLTSLPVDEYFVAGGVNRERRNRKKTNLMRGVVQVPAAGPMPKITRVEVGCQAIAAFFDMMLDETGTPRGDVPEAVAIVDIGGSTTDIAVILDGQNIDEARSGAARLGVLDVHTGLRRRLTTHFGFDMPLSPTMIDKATRSGTVKVWNEPHDIKALITDAVADVASQIQREIDRRIGNAATLDQVLFVGGGAALFRDIVGQWRNAHVPDDADFANARGLLKYQLWVE